jgi:PQQ-dependent catabolism-associated beta-propeller protein
MLAIAVGAGIFALFSRTLQATLFIVVRNQCQSRCVLNAATVDRRYWPRCGSCDAIFLFHRRNGAVLCKGALLFKFNRPELDPDTPGERHMFDLRRLAVFGLSLLGVFLSLDSASAFRAYVSNEKGNSVSVIDTDKMETIATIKTGQRPRGIEVSRDGKLVYVALGDDDTIQVIDTKSLSVVGDLPSGPDPEQFTLDPAGKLLYVANENDAMVTVIDVEKRAAVGEVSVGIEPEGMAVSPDSKILVCTSETTSMVHFIDTTSREIVGNLLVGSRPRFSAYKSDGSELWVTSEIGGALAIIDPATRQLKQTVNFEIPGLRSEAIQPVGINITGDGKLGFVDLGPANRVAVIDGVTHAVLKYLLVGQRVWHGAFTPDEKYLLVANGVSNDVSVIDVAAQKVIKSIQVGELPWGVAFGPN